jgi:2,3-bisphosphoglycerate-dependent phosphoglycerate mutase
MKSFATAPRLVVIRHGESAWNAENRFAGWVDVDLTARGVDEARQAGRSLKRQAWEFDACHTSLLKRAHRTLWHVLDELDRTWLPVAHSWRLNERHYGALQGLNRADAAARFGQQQVKRWRRGYDARPPLLDAAAAARERSDRRYAGIAAGEFPCAESLADTTARVLPLWRDTLRPALRQGQTLMLVAHGNSIRALMALVEGLGEADFPVDDIPHGTPLVYEFDAAANMVARSYLDRAPHHDH